MSSTTPRLDALERNVLINGNYDFWQRGTTAVIPASGGVVTYMADRWAVRRAGTTGAVTLTQDTDVPTKAQSGWQSKFSQKISCSTAEASIASGEFMVYRQSVEGYAMQELVGRKATLSFWVKCSYAGNFAVTALGTQGAVGAYVVDFTVIAPNTWEKKTITIDFTNASTTFFNYDNTLGVNLDWQLAIGPDRVTATKNSWVVTGTTIMGSNTASNFLSSTSNAMWLAQVQLVPNDLTSNSGIDANFRRAGSTIQQELAMCQRYYEKSFDTDTAPGANSSAGGLASFYALDGGTLTRAFLVTNFHFKVPKRAGSGTIMLYSGDGTHAGTNGTISVYNNDTLKINISSFTAGTHGFLQFATAASALTSGAVYVANWTIESEL